MGLCNPTTELSINQLLQYPRLLISHFDSAAALSTCQAHQAHHSEEQR